MTDGFAHSQSSAFAPGAAIGIYCLETVIGRGGMGIVFRGRDTRLDRPVAIKVLSATLADPAARRRFQREAQLASSLNHPHIVTVFDAGEINGEQYLVTEFIDGGTLKDWAAAAPRSSQEIAELLTGVADALAEAHAAGILHRDIKPANVLVTKNGYAKLADFGLAKLQDPGEPSVLETRQTLTEHTRLGTLMGTVAYMSPEQAAGRPLDQRTDIFSFGVMLYELLGGRRPFSGPSDAQVLNLIQHGDPAPLQAGVPSRLRTLVDRAIQKDRERRYQSMREVVYELKLARGAGNDVTLPLPRPRRTRIVVWSGAVAGLVLASAAALEMLWQRDFFWRNPLENASVQTLTDFPGDEFDGAISPDGTLAGFLSDRDGPMDIWLTPTAGGEAVNVTNGQFPALYPGPIRYLGFSADSTLLWFLEQTSLRSNRFRTWIKAVATGAPRVFLEAGIHPAWSPDGKWLVYHTPDAGDPIFIADRSGNNAREIAIDKPGVHNHFLSWSPDGRFVYLVKGVVATDEMDLWRIPITVDGNAAPAEQLTQLNSRVGYIAWLNARTLIFSATAADGAGRWLYALDVEHKIPHRVSAGVSEEYLSVAASANAQRVVTTVARPAATLWTVPITDHAVSDDALERIVTPNTRALGPRLSGETMFFLSSKGGPDGLWRSLAGAAQELWKGSDGGVVAPPAISPDGNHIAVAIRRQGRAALYRMSVNGTNVQLVTDALDVRGSLAWSPDGQWIAFSGASGPTSTRVYKVRITGGAPAALAPAISSRPVWSPDGRMIVYSLPLEGGRMQAKAMTPEGTPLPLPEVWVNYQTGSAYRFVPGRHALAYLKEGDTRHQNFFLIDLDSGEERQLTDLQGGYEVRDFDVSPDGRRIVFDQLRDNSDIVLLDLAR